VCVECMYLYECAYLCATLLLLRAVSGCAACSTYLCALAPAEGRKFLVS